MLFLGKNNTAKIQSRTVLRRTISRLKKHNKTIVFTNGCFDLLHVGHVRLFQKAKSLGDVLIVAINADASLRRLKGPRRPLVGQALRAEVLASMAAVDYVTVFSEDTPAEIIAELKPDILVKGGDYRTDQIVGRRDVKKVVRFRFVKGQSTTGLIGEIVKRYGKHQ
jgi:D-beta-D-heptose 7-phosphate kinase/D-beta-D-heptose 1-phosphate adenosyltransferase